MIVLSRIVNAVKLYASFGVSLLIHKPVVWGLPVAVSIEPLCSCNLHCPECATGSGKLARPSYNLDLSLYKKIVDELHPYLLNIYLYFQGEPFLHPQLVEMVRYASLFRIATTVSTNGHYLTQTVAEQIVKAGLSKCIVSLDGATQQSYESYRKGGSLEKVLLGITNLVEAREKLKTKKPKLIIQCLLFRHNEHEMEAIKEIFRQSGADQLVFKSAQFTDFETGNTLMPTTEKFLRYKKDDMGKYRVKGKLSNYCLRLWRAPVITCEGDIIPCCFDKNADYKFGNLHNNSFEEIWHNEKYRRFRNLIFKNRAAIPICRNCTEGHNLGTGLIKTE